MSELENVSEAWDMPMQRRSEFRYIQYRCSSRVFQLTSQSMNERISVSSIIWISSIVMKCADKRMIYLNMAKNQLSKISMSEC